MPPRQQQQHQEFEANFEPLVVPLLPVEDGQYLLGFGMDVNMYAPVSPPPPLHYFNHPIQPEQPPSPSILVPFGEYIQQREYRDNLPTPPPPPSPSPPLPSPAQPIRLPEEVYPRWACVIFADILRRGMAAGVPDALEVNLYVDPQELPRWVYQCVEEIYQRGLEAGYPAVDIDGEEFVPQFPADVPPPPPEPPVHSPSPSPSPPPTPPPQEVYPRWVNRVFANVLIAGIGAGAPAALELNLWGDDDLPQWVYAVYADIYWQGVEAGLPADDNAEVIDADLIEYEFDWGLAPDSGYDSMSESEMGEEEE